MGADYCILPSVITISSLVPTEILNQIFLNFIALPYCFLPVIYVTFHVAFGYQSFRERVNKMTVITIPI